MSERLLIAAAEGDLQIVREEIENQGADPNYLGYGRVSIKLSKKGEEDYNASYSNSALHIATFYGHTHIVKYLLEQPRINVLLKVKKNTNNQEIPKDLVELEMIPGCGIVPGLNVNLRNDRHQTALEIAIFKGHKEIVELLVKAKADIFWRHEPINELFVRMNEPGAKDLLDCLLNVFVFNDPDQMSSLFWFLEYRKPEEYFKWMKYLLQKGFNISIRNKDGETLLHRATGIKT